MQSAPFYIDGDLDAYRDRIGDVEPIQWYDLSPVDETSFYSYVCQTYSGSNTAFFRAFAELSLVVLPPLVYGADGWLDVTVVGGNEALTRTPDASGRSAGSARST